jgi:hypothetical protein
LEGLLINHKRIIMKDSAVSGCIAAILWKYVKINVPVIVGIR